MDPATAQALERGKRTQEILKQPQYSPLPEELKYLSIWAVTNGYLDDIELEKVGKFETEIHNYIKRNYPKILTAIKTGEKVNETLTKELEKAIKDFKKIFK